MTVEIKNEKLYNIYKDTQATASNRSLSLAAILYAFSNEVITRGLERDCDHEIRKVVGAIMYGEPVQLVEPKYLIYVDLPRQFEQFKMAGDGLDRFTTEKLVTYSDYLQFSQSDVDEIKKMYPFIKTKEVEE